MNRQPPHSRPSTGLGAAGLSENPDLADRPYAGLFADEYGRFDSLADLFRQIGHDERVHKEESLARMTEPRFR